MLSTLSPWITQVGINMFQTVSILVFALLVSWILRIIIRITVKNVVARVTPKKKTSFIPSAFSSERIVQRAKTLGTVLSNIANAAIGTIAFVLILNIFAHEILGSLALLSAALGAGLGFGAQNIVKDILNGMFLVLEDQMGVGDIVDLGSASGVVEIVGIRTTQVRDVHGTLWHVRNGEILRLGNLSQGQSRVIFDLTFASDTDRKECEKHISEILSSLQEDPTIGPKILEPYDFWGVQKRTSQTFTLRISLKTQPEHLQALSQTVQNTLTEQLENIYSNFSLEHVTLNGLQTATPYT